MPSTAIGMSWAGIAFGEPSLLNLPMRGPRIIAPARAQTPPVMCTTLDPAKSTWPLPRPKFDAEVGEPAAAPHPAAENRVEEAST